MNKDTAYDILRQELPDTPVKTIMAFLADITSEELRATDKPDRWTTAFRDGLIVQMYKRWEREHKDG